MIGEFWPQANLTHLFHFEGNANDESGNGNHGTNNGAVFSLANGKLRQGAGFGGSQSINNIPFNGFPTTVTVLSVCFWAKVNGANNSLMNLMSDDIPDRLNIHFPYSNTVFWDFGNAESGSGRTSFAWDSNWNNAWAWWVLQGDGSNMKVYRNGNLIHSASGKTTTFTKGAKLLRLGDQANGQVDEFVILNRALSAQEIRKWYAWSRGKLQ